MHSSYHQILIWLKTETSSSHWPSRNDALTAVQKLSFVTPVAEPNIKLGNHLWTQLYEKNSYRIEKQQNVKLTGTRWRKFPTTATRDGPPASTDRFCGLSEFLWYWSVVKGFRPSLRVTGLSWAPVSQNKTDNWSTYEC